MRESISGVLKGKLSSFDIVCAFLEFVGQLTIFAWNKCIVVIRCIGKYCWQNKLRFCTDLVLAILFVAIGITGSNAYRRNVERQVADKLIISIDHYASFKREFRRDVASDNPREFMNVGAPTWLRHTAIKEVLVEARKANLGVAETAVLLAIADRESGFNPLAKAKSTTACGVNQFITETGRRYGLKETSCFNPSPNTHAQVKHFKQIISQPNVRTVLRGKTDQEQMVFMFREVYCRHHDGEHMKLCSETAEAMTAKSLPMLFGAYKVLHTENARTANTHFLYAVCNTLKKMQFWASSQITSIL